MTKIKIKESELQSKQATLKFLRLFGRDELENVHNQFARQRVLPEKIAGFTPEQIKKLPDDKYQENRDEIMEALGSVASDDVDIEAEVNVPEGNFTTAWQWQETFESLLGKERLLQALSVPEELQVAAKRNYWKRVGRKPYTTRVVQKKGETSRVKIEEIDPNEV